MASEAPVRLANMRFLKPDGAESFEGALCDEGWILLWSDRRAHAWSEEGGWLTLPDAPGRLEGARAALGGVVAIGEGDIGFWVHGEDQWRWWARVPPGRAGSSRSLNLSGAILRDALVIHAVQIPTNTLWVYHLGADQIDLLTTIHDDEPGRFLQAWQEDDPAGQLTFLFENGLYALHSPHDAKLEARPSAARRRGAFLVRERGRALSGKARGAQGFAARGAPRYPPLDR